MNDAPSPSNEARLDGPSPQRERPSWSRQSSYAGPATSSRSRAGSYISRSRAGSNINGRRRKRKSRKKRNPGLVKKLEFVTHLLKSLDTLVFAELSALYYMECSLLRFLLRAAVQYLYLTPKEETLPIIMPATRAHVFLVVVPNIICILLHVFTSMPSGHDFHRGYVHGGVVIDFVGQMPSKSRVYYILIDIMLLVLQSLMMTIHNEREKLRVTLKTFRPLPGIAQDVALARTVESLDAEERGLPREESSGLGAEGSNDIEMQSLNGEGTQADGPDRADDPDNEARDVLGDGSDQNHLADVFTSGNGVLGDYHVLHSMRTAGTQLEDAAAGTLRRIGYEATAVALEARRRQGAVRGQIHGPVR